MAFLDEKDTGGGPGCVACLLVVPDQHDRLRP
jgi:hypothetical protein